MMYFISGLPLTLTRKDSIWVIGNRFTKSAHFLLVCKTFSWYQLADLYIREIAHLHGVPVSIILDQDPRFTSRFWKVLHEALDLKLHFSLAYHLQSDV